MIAGFLSEILLKVRMEVETVDAGDGPGLRVGRPDFVMEEKSKGVKYEASKSGEDWQTISVKERELRKTCPQC